MLIAYNSCDVCGIQIMDKWGEKFEKFFATKDRQDAELYSFSHYKRLAIKTWI